MGWLAIYDGNTGRPVKILGDPEMSVTRPPEDLGPGVQARWKTWRRWPERQREDQEILRQRMAENVSKALEASAPKTKP